jgi:23S rRNA (uridine2552-2'-O)-methyltransferase
MQPLPGVAALTLDAGLPENETALRQALGGLADVVLSDMAPNASGHAGVDHLRIVALVEQAAELALRLLRPGGAFVAKVWQGGAEGELLARLKRAFASVRHAKPKASRAESAEVYLVALGFRSETGSAPAA